MVQLASHSTFSSSSPRIASSFALGLVSAPSAIGTIFTALRGEAKSAEAANLGEPLGTSARKADKSACAAYFCVDSRNENLPEKWYSPKLREPARRELLPVFVARMRAPAMRFRLGIERDDMGISDRGVPRSARSCSAIFGCRNGSPPPRPCFRPVIYREPYNSAVFPGLNARATTGSRPTAPAATAPEGPGGRRRADRPSSAPAWASLAATVWGGARRR